MQNFANVYKNKNLLVKIDFISKVNKYSEKFINKFVKFLL